ncbi:hypothetical protein NQ318_001549 [Aromia moschata]|uniref:Uncharacterized protein n=1 Tax=Aromia moschata TaxID=1265417 RepID=A0AAV8Y994_9CUCU|nr:hypothetical protein NQ318_001549 [Aromia moschata]
MIPKWILLTILLGASACAQEATNFDGDVEEIPLDTGSLDTVPPVQEQNFPGNDTGGGGGLPGNYEPVEPSPPPDLTPVESEPESDTIDTNNNDDVGNINPSWTIQKTGRSGKYVTYYGADYG